MWCFVRITLHAYYLFKTQCLRGKENCNCFKVHQHLYNNDKELDSFMRCCSLALLDLNCSLYCCFHTACTCLGNIVIKEGTLGIFLAVLASWTILRCVSQFCYWAWADFSIWEWILKECNYVWQFPVSNTWILYNHSYTVRVFKVD